MLKNVLDTGLFECAADLFLKDFFKAVRFFFILLNFFSLW